MSVMLLDVEDTGGIPVSVGGADGGQVERPGQLQYGSMLLGGGSSARWRELVGWRSLPSAQASDSPRPQAHGAYPGDVFGDSLVVTFIYQVRGSREAKIAALNAIEKYAPMDGTERCLAVDDGDGTWCRMARVIDRQVPQGRHFQHEPVECSIQFLCADPRRYRLAEQTGSVMLPESSGGLEYALDYPLEYGESSSGQLSATNRGSLATPLVAEFIGPLTQPILIASDWRMGFNITLADGETLTVDTSAGTALLNGTADRLYLIRNDSSPLERCLLRPGTTNLSLTATSEIGRAHV